MIDFQQAAVEILMQIILKDGRRLLLIDEQRRKLAELGQKLTPDLRREYITIVKPETLMGWYRRLVKKKYDSSKVPGRKPGRPPKADELRQLICRIARENPLWGYTRICDQLRHLGHGICRTTIANILTEEGLTPDPERRQERTWAEFIAQHKAAIWATDFLTVDTLCGCFYILKVAHSLRSLSA